MTPETASPFQSPQADENESIRALIGDTNFKIAQRVQAVYTALMWQVICLISAPILAIGAGMLPDQELAQMISTGINLTLLISVQSFSVWSVFRLCRATGASWLTTAIHGGLALFPCISIFALLQVSESAREMLEKAGIPFQHSGPDWSRVQQIADSQQGASYASPFDLPAANQLYNLVFCDNVDYLAPIDPSTPGPDWIELPESFDRADILRSIVQDTAADCRVRLLAARQLAAFKDTELPEKGLPEQGLGIVFEATHKEGMYVVAMYADGGLVCLRSDSTFQLLPPGDEGLARQVREVVHNVFQKQHAYASYPFQRPEPPSPGEARITLLTTSGTRVAQASWKVFYRHPATQIVAEAMVTLVDELYGFAPPQKDASESQIVNQLANAMRATPTVTHFRRMVRIAMGIYAFAMIVIGLAIAGLIDRWDWALVLYQGAVLFGIYAEFRLMRSLNATSRGITYGVLLLVPVLGFVGLALADFAAGRFLKQSNGLDDDTRAFPPLE